MIKIIYQTEIAGYSVVEPKPDVPPYMADKLYAWAREALDARNVLDYLDHLSDIEPHYNDL